MDSLALSSTSVWSILQEVGVVRECFGAGCLGKGWPNESQSHLLNMI